MEAPRGRGRSAVLLTLAVAAGLGAAVALAGRGSPSDLPVVEVRIGGAKVKAEVAATDSQRTRGLMYRDHLPRDRGMLFAYPDARPLSFWMRNTSIPLDIAYIGADLRVVRVASMRPRTDTSHPSGAPAQYALEVNQGWMAEHGVKEGSVVAFELPQGLVPTAGDGK